MKILPIAILALLTILAVLNGFSSIPYVADLETVVLQHFLFLVLIALIIERAVEVYINNAFYQKEMDASSKVRVQKRKVAFLEEAIKAEQKISSEAVGPQSVGLMEMSAGAIGELRAQLGETRAAKIEADSDTLEARMTVQQEKALRSSIAATVLGAAVAAAGVHTLSAFVDVDCIAKVAAASGGAPVCQALDGMQRQFFNAADIVVTALLLAGGADGIHQIVKDFLKVRKELPLT